ncbi:hypothetical protein [Raoultibacter massiliensis]|uniref:MFS transporter n=2 Tax=Raoultibacter massiliensis TaxID=1852371 RepID=A0ABV1JFG0_9ACTN
MLNTNAGAFRNKTTALSNAVYIESPLVIGFAVQLFWLFILFFQAFFLHDNARAINELQFVSLGLSFLIVFPATCFAIGYYRDRVTRYLRKKSVHFLMGLCGAIGMLCAGSVMLSDGQAPFALALAGTVLASFACAPATLLWGEAARRRDQSKLALATILSLLLAFALILALAYFVETSPFGAVVIACLGPLFSVVFVYKAQHDNESYFKPQEFVTLPDGTTRAKEGKA